MMTEKMNARKAGNLSFCIRMIAIQVFLKLFRFVKSQRKAAEKLERTQVYHEFSWKYVFPPFWKDITQIEMNFVS